MAKVINKGAMPIKFRKNFGGSMASLDIAGFGGVNSVYAARAAATQLSAQLYKAVRLYKLGMADNSKAFVGLLDDGRIAVELEETYQGTTSTQSCVIDIASGKVLASVNVGGNPVPYVMASPANRAGRSGTVVLLGLLTKVSEDAEGKEALDRVLAYAGKGESDQWSASELDGLGNALALLGDNIYRRLGFNFKPGDKGKGELQYPDLLLEPPTAIGLLTKQASFEVAKNIVGTPALFKAAPEATAAPAVTEAPATTATPKPTEKAEPTEAPKATEAPEDILEIDLGEFGTTEYSSEEQAVFAAQRKSVLSVLRQVSGWMSNMAYAIIDSFSYSQPKSTFGLFGPAGCGKSFGTAVIAQLLKLIRIIYGCQPDTDIVSLFGTIIPNVGCQSVNTDDIRRELNLPTEAEIMADVEGSAARMGLADGASAAEVIAAMASAVNVEAARRAKDFRYEEGPVTRALRNGYLLEIQEAGTIRRPGVLVGLNALLESGKDIKVTLPTGEVIRKHPHAVVCFTSNDEYEGTCQLNQSVLSRMADVLYFENPSVETLAARAKVACPDFPDDALMSTMAECIANACDFLKSHDITSGVCGQRELNSWAQGCMSLVRRRGGKLSNAIVRETAQSAVLNKVAQDRESIAEVASAIFNPKFGDFANTISC